MTPLTVVSASRDPVRTGLTLLRLSLTQHEPLADNLWAVLDPQERERAHRFLRRDDAARYIVGHARLRQRLGARLGVAPQDLQFTENIHGKPMLDGLTCAPHFNLSHSGDWVLIAIDEHDPVGIDVEAVRPNMSQIDDFRGVLAPEEQEWLDRMPADERARAFARTWVRKEAYVKALGEGMSRELRSIAVVDGPHGHPVMLYDRNTSGNDPSWRLADLTIDDAHVACLAYHGDA